MSVADADAWSVFSDSTLQLKREIGRARATSVSSPDIRASARALVEHYFRHTRHELLLLGIDQAMIEELDELMKQLFSMSNGTSRRTTYHAALVALVQLNQRISIARELRFSEVAYVNAVPQGVSLSALEGSIFDTLNRLVPSAARSYRQALIDLSADDRLSYRGPANELREGLREALDYLAPDDEVGAADGFQLVEGQATPTMRQKVRYILRARGISSNALKVPISAIDAIEEKVAILTRATYVRSNISTHVETEKAEVQRVRNYVNAVLAELLELG